MSKFSFTRAQTPENVFAALSQFQDELERRISFGQGQWVFDGLSNTKTVTITHELAGTPRGIQITPDFADLGTGLAVMTLNVGATTFDATCVTVDGSTPGGGSKTNFWWLALI